MSGDIKDYYDNLRRTNELRRERRKREIYDKIPELERIDGELRKISANMALSAFENALDSEQIAKLAQEKIKVLQARRAVLLTDHDYPPNYLDPIYTCELCKDKGFVMREPCKCYKRKKFERSAKLSNLHALMQHENFERFDYSLYSDRELEDGHFLKSPNTKSLRDYMRSVVHCLKLFVEDENIGVYIYGHTGVGKTFLCSSVCKYAVERGLSVEYYSMKALVDIIDNYRFNNRSKFSDPEEDEFKRAYQNLSKCDLLILDDLGSELKSQNMVSELFFIVNERMALKKKTIISSNIGIEGIAAVYEERVASRILGTYIHLPIVGEDLRRI